MTPGANVSLREITRGNLHEILGLDVSEAQKVSYPRSNAYSIAEGHHPPDDDAVWMRAIYAGDVPVGFLMTSEAPERGEYFLWRLMIDARHQGRGYGREAVRLLLERIASRADARFLLTSHLPGDRAAGRFYEAIGFRYTGEVLGERDLLMRIDFASSGR